MTDFGIRALGVRADVQHPRLGRVGWQLRCRRQQSAAEPSGKTEGQRQKPPPCGRELHVILPPPTKTARARSFPLSSYFNVICYNIQLFSSKAGTRKTLLPSSLALLPGLAPVESAIPFSTPLVRGVSRTTPPSAAPAFRRIATAVLQSSARKWRSPDRACARASTSEGRGTPGCRWLRCDSRRRARYG